MSTSILVTGGAGYIGSHAVLRLLRDGHRVTAVDNLFRGHAEAIDAIRRAVGPEAASRLTFEPGDVGDRELLLTLLTRHKVTTVMHFAALAYVGESVNEPLRYYRANTAASLALLEAVQNSWTLGRSDYRGVERFIFSSTCASYGEPAPERIPIAETTPQSPINPYGWSKLHVERMLLDFANLAEIQKRPLGVGILRYFNVAGSDKTGAIGEHHEPETHLIPICLQAVLGVRESLTIFGTDYPTPDGTCIRDYVHVEDLVDAHVKTMEALKPGDRRIYNLGIGRGYSVREIVESVVRVTGRRFTVKEGQRRAGDPPTLYADPSKIRRELGWTARYTELDEIVRTAWKWFEAHPRGYTP